MGRLVAAWAVVATLVVGVLFANQPAAHAQATEIVVTSAADLEEGDRQCPSEDACTLREAILVANAAASEGEVRITFDSGVFPSATPATIALADEPLPQITRKAVSIDAAGAGVVVDGAGLEGKTAGLRSSGEATIVRGLTLVEFEGPCIHVTGAAATLGGDRLAGAGNRLGNCETGILAEGPRAVILGNVIGFLRDGTTAAPVTVGVDIQEGPATVGGEAAPAALANFIGNADDAIRVGGAPGAAFAGVLIGGNTIGKTAAGASAPVERGVVVLPPVTAARIVENSISFATGAAIALPAASGTPAGSVTVSANSFSDLGGLEIDLDGDGERNLNDAGDGDAGPNTLLNHPIVSRAAQAAITGIACSGCRVELYRAFHEPGGARDAATTLIANTTADSSGSFAFNSPPVVPGEWVTATATDGAGNTSEFGPAQRVGVGAIQCGNVSLATGWNHAGFFGSAAVELGAHFPGDAEGVVRAVYQLRPDGTFRHWFRDTTVGRTLTGLEPGRAYWFLLDAPLVLPDGFTLTASLGVELGAGWNDFVYFGASADVRDAFRTILEEGTEVYTWEPGLDGGWRAWRTLRTPGYARDFTQILACGAYLVKLDGPAILTPLHP
jgi:CSLREA domain-containing protein